MNNNETLKTSVQFLHITKDISSETTKKSIFAEYIYIIILLKSEQVTAHGPHKPLVFVDSANTVC